MDFKLFPNYNCIYKRFLLILVLILSGLYCITAEEIVHDGLVDLTSDSINFEKSYLLKGDWIFFPGELLTQKNIKKKYRGDFKHISLPGFWDPSDEILNEKQYATYYVKVIKPKGYYPLILYVEDAYVACKIFLNDSMIYSAGQVGTKKLSSLPHRFPIYVNVLSEKQEFDLIVQVSNFRHQKGGLGEMYIGTPDSIYNARDKRNFVNIFLFGTFVMMAIYHLGLFFTRRENKTTLFFGLFCFLLSVRIWIMSEFQFLGNQDIGWNLALKIEFLTFFISAPVFVFYTKYLFPKFFSDKITKVFAGISLLYSLALLLFPPRFSSIILPGYQLAVGLIGVYITYIGINEYKEKASGSGVFILGWLILFIATINDILYFNEISTVRNLIFLGLFIFIFFQAFLLSQKFSNAFVQVEKLADQLNYTNKNLSNLIKEKTKELKNQNEEIEVRHEQLKVLIDNLPDIIYFKDKKARFITANNKTVRVMKAESLDNLIGKTDLDFYPKDIAEEYNNDDLSVLKQGKPIYKKQENCFDERGEKIIQETSKIPLFDKDGQVYGLVGIGRDISIQKEYEGQLLNQTKKLQEINTLMEERQEEIIQQQELLKMQRDNLNQQKQLIEQKNKDITDSLNYASKIQDAVLPSKVSMDIFFADHFVLYKPKDIVSGDFYWTRRIRNKILITAADCTGHGVPGAFMSLLGISFLNEIVNNLMAQEDSRVRPNFVLEELRNRIKHALKQTGSIDESQDGIDMALCIIDYAENKLYYSGANNPLYIINRKTRKLKLEKELLEQKRIIVTEHDEVRLIEVKANRMPIGSYISEHEFTTHVFDLTNVDHVYMFSDGYTDQIGGKRRNKFRQKRFKELLMKIYPKTMKEQEEILNESLMAWKGDQCIQIDDILVVGIKLSENREEQAFGFFED